MTNKIKPFAENDNIELYFGQSKDLLNLEGIKPRLLFFKKYLIEPEEVANPFSNVEDGIDYLVSCRDSWERLPDDFPTFKIKRTDIHNYQISRDENPLYLHSHTQPMMMIDENMIQRFQNVACVPFRNRTTQRLLTNVENVLLENAPQAYMIPILEYSCLEQFCEFTLGPSIRESQYRKELGDSLRNVTNEEDAEVEIKKIKHLKGISTEDKTQLWCGLNVFYPDFRERMQRISEFELNWFPEETFRARKSYEDLREFLKTLKGGRK